MEDNKKRLYQALIADYDLGDFDTFAKDVEDSTKRKSLYDAISQDYDLGDFDSFTNQLLGSKPSSSDTPMAEKPAVATDNYVLPTPFLSEENKPFAEEHPMGLESQGEIITPFRAEDEKLTTTYQEALSKKGTDLGGPIDMEGTIAKARQTADFAGGVAGEIKAQSGNPFPPKLSATDLDAFKTPEQKAEENYFNRAGDQALYYLQAENQLNAELKAVEEELAALEKEYGQSEEYRRSLMMRSMQQGVDQMAWDEYTFAPPRLIELQKRRTALLQAKEHKAVAEEIGRNKMEYGTVGEYFSNVLTGAKSFAKEKLSSVDPRNRSVEVLADKLSLSRKLTNGETLSPDEQDAWTIYALEDMMEGRYGKSKEDFGYIAGYAAPMMVEFMAELALSPGKGLAKGAMTAAERHAAKTTQWLIRKYGVSAVRNTLRRMGAGIYKQGARLAGATANAAIAAHTVQADDLVKGTMERMAGTAVGTPDEEGNLAGTGVKGAKGLGRAYYEQAANMTIENLTEAIFEGAGIGNGFKSLLTGTGKKLAGTKVGGKVVGAAAKLADTKTVKAMSELIENTKSSNWYQSVSKLKLAGHLGSIPEEMMEEYAAIPFRHWLGVNDGEQGLVEEFTSWQTFYNTAAGLSLGMGAMTAVQVVPPATAMAAGAVWDKYNMFRTHRNLIRRDKEGQNLFGAEWEAVKTQIESFTEENFGEGMDALVEEFDSPEKKDAAWRYAQSLQQDRGFNTMRQKAKEEGESDPLADAREEGYEAEDPQQIDAWRAEYDSLHAKWGSLVEEVAEQYDGLNLFFDAIRENPSGETAMREILRYYELKERIEGAEARKADEAETDEEALRSNVARRTNQETGKIVTVNILGDNGQPAVDIATGEPASYYVINGATDMGDGNVALSDGMVVLRDADGNRQALPGDKLRLVSVMQPEHIIAEEQARAAQEAAAPAQEAAPEPAVAAGNSADLAAELDKTEEGRGVKEQVEAWFAQGEEPGSVEQLLNSTAGSFAPFGMDYYNALAAESQANAAPAAEPANAAAPAEGAVGASSAPTSRIMRKKGAIDAEASFENGATAQEMADAIVSEYGDEEGLPLSTAKEYLAQIQEERQSTKDIFRKNGPLRKQEKFWNEVVDLLTPKEEAPAEEGRQETVGTPVALQYLLEGGKGSIENAGYFFYAIQAAFPHIGSQLQEIRNSMPAEMLGMAPDAFVASNTSQLQEVRRLVEATYGEAGTRILDQMLANSTGFYPREGKALDLEIENLKPVELENAPEEGAEGVTEEEADALISLMKETADVAAERELTPEAWEEEFGEDGITETPVGPVKMGENQYLKLLKKKRGGYFGMIKPTLTNPDIVLEEIDEKEGAERQSKYLFVKTFVKPDGSRYVHFESVTVMKDSLEVSISSHEVNEDALKRKMQHDKMLHLDKRFLNSDGRLIEPPVEGSDLVPTPNIVSSADKGTDKSVTAEGTQEEISEKGQNATQSEQNELENVSELGVFGPDNASEFAKRLYETHKWKTLEDAGNTLKRLLASYGKNLNGQTLGVLPFLDAAQELIGLEKAEKERIDALVPAIEDVADDMQTADEFVAGLFGNGIRITPESFRKETGLGWEEQRRLVGIIAGNEKGGLTVEQAAETIVENYRAELAERGFSGDSMEMRDMVIDILNSGNPRAYAKQAAARRAEQALHREMEAFDRYTQEAFHMSAEEYIMYEESMLPKYIEQYKDFDEQEYYSNFADEQSTQNEHDTTRESAETGGSREILSEEQPSATPGEGTAGEGQRGGTLQGDVQGNAQEGLARAEAGQEVAEQPAEKESRTRFSTSMFEDAERIAREEQRRAPLRRTARAWEKLLGVKVTLMERLEDVKNPVARREIEAAEKKGKKVPGWYSEKEGVFLYLPHVKDVTEVDKTCVHEIVSHKGLKELLGQEKFDELCLKVWGIMSPAERKEYMSYPNVETKLQAADEYMARLSEEVELTARERSVWQKIMDFIAGLLGRKADNQSKAASIVGKETLSRKDIAELVRLSYAEYLQRNGNATETVKDAVGLDEGTGFSVDEKASFSDRSDAVSDNSSSKGLLNGGSAHLSHSTLAPQEDVAKLLKNNEVTISSAQKVINEGGLRGFTKVETAIRTLGTKLKLQKSKSSMSYYGDFYEGDFIVDGLTLHLRLSTHPANGGRMGNADADDKVSIVIRKDGEHFSPGEHNGYVEYVYEPEEVSLDDAANAILKGVVNLITEGEFIDETGKAHANTYPFIDEEGVARFRTVYHGSAADFNKFDRSFSGSGEGQAVMGAGHYVTTSEGTGRYYAEVASEMRRKVVQEGGYTYNGKVVRSRPLVDAYEALKKNEFDVDKAIESIEHRIAVIRRVKGDKANTTNAEESIRFLNEEKANKGILGYQEEIVEKPARHLYEVEIPDDNGKNYFDLDKRAPKKTKDEAKKRLLNALDNGEEGSYWKKNRDIIEDEWRYNVNNPDATNNSVRATMEQFLTQEEVADILSDMGYVGSKSKATEGTTYIIYKDDNIEIKSNTRFRVSNDNQEIFVSNAQRAVEGIKQEKGTPQQWLAMIEKNGGLKAGEDKWLGLSDWLKGMDQKSVTKDEILDFIGENKIRIEEVTYGEEAGGYSEEKLDEFNAEYEELIWEGEEETGSIYANDWADYAYEAMVARYGDDFRNAFDTEGVGTGSRLVPHYYYDGTLSEEAKQFVGEEGANDNEINSTRLEYTTEGLDNKQEIALTVPTIEPWNQSDDIHFGDAGGGRAVAWIRFGETTIEDKNVTEKSKILGSKEWWNMSEEERKSIMDELKNLKQNSRPTKVLVIDEIQSKRHQEGREKGYNNPRVIQILDRMNEIQKDLYSPYGVSEEVHAEKKALQEELEAAFESENPQMKKVAEQIKEKEARLSEMNREKAEKENDEKVEMLKLQDRQLETRNVREYDYYEQEINNIKEAQERRDDEIDELRSSIRNLNEEYSHYYNSELRNARVGVMPAPFEKNWHELAMKRMIRYAAENGFDKVAWTTGAQQAERYNLGKYFSDIEREDNPSIEGRRFVLHGGNVEALHVDESGNVIESTIEEAIGKPLADVVGKSMADRMMSMDNGDMIEGEDLRIGGEGMKGFYDKMLPSFVQKYTKKWGAKVGEVELPHLEEGAQKMWSVDVTPEMKESVMEGQTMFRVTDDKPADAIRRAYDGEMRTARFLTKETMVDYLASVKTLLDTIAKKTGKGITDPQNVYRAMLTLTNKNTQELAAFDYGVLPHLTKAIAGILGKEWNGDWDAPEAATLQRYAKVKHGIERDRDMAVRRAIPRMAEQKYREQFGELDRMIAAEIDAEALEALRTKKAAMLADPKAYGMQTADEIAEQMEQQWYDRIAEIRRGEGTWREKQQRMDAAIADVFGLDAEGLETYGLTLTEDYSGMTETLVAEGEIDRKTARKVSGAVREAAYDFVEQYEERTGADKTDALWDGVRAVSAYSLEKQRRTGLVDAKYVEDCNRRYEFYVPLRNFAETTADEVYDYLDETYNDNNPVKTARGRRSEAGNPFSNVMMLGYQSITAGNKNAAVQHFWNLANRPDVKGFLVPSRTWHLAELDDAQREEVNEKLGGIADTTGDVILPRIPENATAQQVQDIISDFEDVMKDLKKSGLAFQGKKRARQEYRLTSKQQENAHRVKVYVNGEARYVTIVGDPRAALALNGKLNPESGVPEKYKAMQRFLSGAFTSQNPSFALANIIRDTQHANMRAFITESGTYWAKFSAKQAAMMKPARLAFLLAKYENSMGNTGRHGWGGELDMRNETHRNFKRFMELGGATGYTFSHKEIENLKKLADMAERAENKTPKGQGYVVGEIFDFIRLCSESAELINRFAAFEASLELGRSEQRAISDAQEITLNFSRKGAGKKTYNPDRKGKTWLESRKYNAVNAIAWLSQFGRDHLIFWNAAVQGSYQTYKMIREHPAKTTFALGGVPIALSAFALPALNALICAFMGDDEDAYYDELPDYVRQRNICIKVPGGWFKIPLDPATQKVWAMGDAVGAAWRGKRQIDYWGDLGANLVGLFSPVDIYWGDRNDNLSERALSAATSFTPTLIQPLLHSYANRDWKGKPLYNDSRYIDQLPSYAKSFKSDKESLKALSKFLNDVGNSDADSYGRTWHDFAPPGVMEELLYGYTGGYGQLALAAVEGAIAVVSDDAKGNFRWDNMPVVNRLWVEGDPGQTRLNIYRNYRDTAVDFMENVEQRRSQINREYKEAKRSHDTFAEAEALAKMKQLYDGDYQRYEILNNSDKLFQKYMKGSRIEDVPDFVIKGMLEAIEIVNNPGGEKEEKKSENDK